MRLFIAYREDRMQYDVRDLETVYEVKEVVRDVFGIGPDEGPAGVEQQEKKLLTLTFGGSDLEDHWTLADIGLCTGCTLRAVLRDQVKPAMFIYTVFNDNILPIHDKISFLHTSVAEFRGLVSRKTGLPVGVFRLISCESPTEKKAQGTFFAGLEMFDCRKLGDYHLDLGSTVRVETWDGWSELLKLCILGFTSHVVERLSQDEVVARYQMKVALYVAAHFGHVDLAVTLLRMGIRADEPVGEHPMRQWCHKSLKHVDSLKAPVHEATEAGQLGVLRTFVHNNVCNVLAKDGQGLTPLNIALRRRQKPCASFLLTKHWSKINYTRRVQMPLSIYVKMKRWSDRAKDKVLMLHGQWKSSIKNPRRHGQTDALVGYGVQLDGFNNSKMNSKPDAQMRAEAEAEQRRKRRQIAANSVQGGSPDAVDPETYFKSLALGSSLKFPRLSRWGRAASKASTQEKMRPSAAEAVQEVEADTAAVSASGVVSDEAQSVDSGSLKAATGGTTATKEPGKQRGQNPSPTTTLDPTQSNGVRPRSSSMGEPSRARLKLPPIQEKLRKGKQLSASHQDLTTPSKPEPQQKNKSLFLRTGASPSKPPSKASSSSLSMAESTRSSKDTSSLGASQKHWRSLRTDHSQQNSPRPFVAGSERMTQETLEVYERYRGLNSRDYAKRCLAVASSFREKPWLAQVQQAMDIASQGVKRVAAKQPHLFIRHDEHTLLSASSSPRTSDVITTSDTRSRVATT